MQKYIPHLPLALFTLYFIKVSIFPVNLAEALILAVLGAAACFFEFKNAESKLKSMESKLDQAVKSFSEKAAEIQQIKDQINGLKLSGFVSRPQAMGK